MMTEAAMSRVPPPTSGSISPVATLSTTPTIRPAISTPTIESRPPRMAIASALMSSRESDQSTPWFAPHRMPADAAVTAASPQAMAMARSTRMPTDQDAVWSSETARITTPYRELKNTSDSRITRSDTEPPISVARLMRKSPTNNGASEGRHTAREQQAEARITYRFHPRFGEIVRVRRRLQRGGAAFLVVHQLDGAFACLPAWMTEEAASRFEIGVEPRFPLDVLCSLRNEVDALLGFLASESKTERPDNDAPIRESSDKPVRGRATVRRTACSSKERARDGHRGAAARDRGGAGKGGKRGERR